jgi:hypothetical protein
MRQTPGTCTELTDEEARQWPHTDHHDSKKKALQAEIIMIFQK